MDTCCHNTSCGYPFWPIGNMLCARMIYEITIFTVSILFFSLLMIKKKLTEARGKMSFLFILTLLTSSLGDSMELFKWKVDYLKGEVYWPANLAKKFDTVNLVKTEQTSRLFPAIFKIVQHVSRYEFRQLLLKAICRIRQNIFNSANK